MKLTDYLGDKPFWKVTVRLAVPVALQNVLTSSFQLVDTLMVSRLGDVTLSAVGMAAQWGWMAGLLSFGLCSGMSVFISQYWGIQNLKGIRPRHGTWPSDGDFYFDGFFRCGILRAGVGAGTIQQRPCRRGCGLPVSAHRVLFLSGGCLDVSSVERSARDGAGEAAAVCLHRHDDCKRVCRTTV